MSFRDWPSVRRLLTARSHPTDVPNESPDDLAIRTIAWMMVIVAVHLAVTVYGASIAEHRSAQLERRLAQTQVAEDLYREAARVLASRYGAIARRAEALHSRSQAQREAAVRLRAAASLPQMDVTADELELLAHEDDAVYRLYVALGIAPSFDSQAEEAFVADTVVSNLTEIGLGPMSASGRLHKVRPTARARALPTDVERGAVVPATILPDLKDLIAQTHREVVRRAAAVVALVASLVLFTFAGMMSGRARLVLATLGAVVGSFTAASMILAVDASTTEHVIQALAILLLLLVLRSGFAHLAASTVPNTLEPHEPGIRSQTHVFAGHARNPFSRRVVVAIAITAVASSITDYWYSRAAVTESDASHAAFEHENEYSRSAFDWTTQRAVAFDTMTQILEARTRVAVSGARSELWQLQSGTDRARANSHVWIAAMRDLDRPPSDQLLRLVDDPTYGLEGPVAFYGTGVPWSLPLPPAGDPAFFRAQALWDAANERAIRAHQAMTTFLQALTLFAIAFYFFGQALGLGEGSGSLLLFRVGVLLMAGGLVWGIVSELRALRALDAIAASGQCIANVAKAPGLGSDRAQVAAEYFYRARKHVIDGALKDAAAEFDCAIELRPSFAQARVGRAAILEAELGHVRTLRELADLDDQIQGAAAEVQHVFQESDLVVPFVSSVAVERLRLWPSIYRAIAAARRGEATEGRGLKSLSRDVETKLERIAANADDPHEHFDLAIAFLGARNLPEAKREMDLGFKALGAGPRLQELLPRWAMEELTTLEEYCGSVLKNEDCRRFARQAKDRSIAGGESLGRAKGEVNITKVTPIWVDWEVNVVGFDPSRDSLYTRVFRADPEGRPIALDLLPITAQSIRPTTVQPDSKGPFTVRQLFAANGYCNDAAGIKGELYVNGQFVGEASWNAPAASLRHERAEFVTARFPELNLVICHPADWRPAPPERIKLALGNRWNNVSGGSARLTRGFLTSTGAPAAFFFNLYTLSPDFGWMFRDAMVRVARMGFVESPALPLRYLCPNDLFDPRILAWGDRDPTGVVSVGLVFPDRDRPGAECRVTESIRRLAALPLAPPR
jgi:hypothetical protein